MTYGPDGHTDVLALMLLDDCDPLYKIAIVLLGSQNLRPVEASVELLQSPPPG